MRSFPTPAIMTQAEKIHGCNCDACCHLTPLARRRSARRAKAARSVMYHRHKCSSLKSVVMFMLYNEDEHANQKDNIWLVPDGELIELDTHFELRTFKKLDYCPFCDSRNIEYLGNSKVIP